MADAKISQLPVATTPLAGTELVPLVQGGVTVQSTVDKVLTGTVPSGTANGVLFLNGSKVVTSGSALTFDGSLLKLGSGAALSVQGVAFPASGSGAEIFWDGSESIVQSYNRTSSAYVPLWLESSYTRFGISGSEQMRLTSTGLGIGTSSPGTKLDVFADGGMIRLNGTSGNNLIQASTNSGATGIGLWAGGASRIYSTGSMVFSVNSTLTTGAPSPFSDAMTLNSSGNLGLGVTPSPWGDEFNAFHFGGSGASIASYKAAPTTAEFAYFISNAYNDNLNWIYVRDGLAANYRLFDGTHAWYTAPSGTAGNVISFTQAMTLHASGGLSVGNTTDPSAGSVNVGVGAANSNNYVIRLSAGTSGLSRFIAADTSDAGYLDYDHSVDAWVFRTAGTERARIPAAGGMVVGTAALATSATDGFLYVPTCAGTPTGTPTTQTGTAPIVVDTTNNKLYFYSGGQWRDAGP
jgi:hypothetical protein